MVNRQVTLAQNFLDLLYGDVGKEVLRWILMTAITDGYTFKLADFETIIILDLHDYTPLVL